MTDEGGWGTQETAVSEEQAQEMQTDKVPVPKKPTLAEIESKLRQVDNAELESLKQPVAKPADTEEDARSQFADAFEVPHVVGMQKSLKTRKQKKRFFLFRWFGGNKD